MALSFEEVVDSVGSLALIRFKTKRLPDVILLDILLLFCAGR